MSRKNINSFFENFLIGGSIFVQKKVLQMSHIPDSIVYRDDLVEAVASILAPALRFDKPSNLFIYGKTGTGKTLVVRHVTDSMVNVSSRKNVQLRVIYINCKLKRVADTEYRLVAQLAHEFGKAIPSTGLPTDQVYTIFYEALDSKEQIVILVLDEIDQLAKRAGDNILYNLTRINSELKRAQLSIVGISNDLVFVDHLDARVKSSLSEEEILFPPYNAIQIKGILQERAKKAFREGALKEGVLEKCAAYAAREHGDARRALELLRVAGELAERKNCTYLEIKHIDEAEDKIDRDRLFDVTLNQPPQFQLVLYAILELSSKRHMIITGEVYAVYEQLCKLVKLRPLTQRRISDIVGELDMLGLIQAKLISKGRYGRTKSVSLALPHTTALKIREVLAKSLHL
ncbi:orc1/cdc6 family replication initiation protein [Candidatus Woesearchaeota archaeon]|nr:orc1/cdc6 family replication initiation protein [Candidatus Woesearchaeota archaeon]